MPDSNDPENSPSNTPGEEPPPPPEETHTADASNAGTEPQEDTAPPDDVGQTPPPVDGDFSSRKINVKRVIVVFLAIGILISGVGGVLIAGGIPSLSLGSSCDPGTPNATFATHQSTGPDGERLALQLTDRTDTDYVRVVLGNSEYANMTENGSTVTITQLSQGDTIQYIGHTQCGNETQLGQYTVQ